MGLKLNFQPPHQKICSSYPTIQKPWTYINMKETNERNQQKKTQREWKYFKALPLH
jgi:hypothetical protein